MDLMDSEPLSRQIIGGSHHFCDEPPPATPPPPPGTANPDQDPSIVESGVVPDAVKDFLSAPFDINEPIPAFGQDELDVWETTHEALGLGGISRDMVEEEFNSRRLTPLGYDELYKSYCKIQTRQFNPNSPTMQEEVDRFMTGRYALRMEKKYKRNSNMAGVGLKPVQFSIDHLFCIAAGPGFGAFYPHNPSALGTLTLEPRKVSLWFKDQKAVPQRELDRRYVYVGKSCSNNAFILFTPVSEVPREERRRLHPELFKAIGKTKPRPLEANYRAAYLILIAWLLAPFTNTFWAARQLPFAEGEKKAWDHEDVIKFTNILSTASHDIPFTDLEVVDEDLQTKYSIFGHHYKMLFDDNFFLENWPVVMHSRWGQDVPFHPPCLTTSSEAEKRRSRKFLVDESVKVDEMDVLCVDIAYTFPFIWYGKVMAKLREDWTANGSHLEPGTPIFRENPLTWNDQEDGKQPALSERELNQLVEQLSPDQEAVTLYDGQGQIIQWWNAENPVAAAGLLNFDARLPALDAGEPYGRPLLSLNNLFTQDEAGPATEDMWDSEASDNERRSEPEQRWLKPKGWAYFPLAYDPTLGNLRTSSILMHAAKSLQILNIALNPGRQAERVIYSMGRQVYNNIAHAMKGPYRHLETGQGHMTAVAVAAYMEGSGPKVGRQLRPSSKLVQHLVPHRRHVTQ
ncbi:hypothetical protein M422DRAFT_259096 [Sphaerobolus stellatus SS14]|uniref:Uncharacterized protein n=1 Tax=Sphaerobolus stellatus (strain SS14) TaxID=990650 RepID=A0A0C9UTI2_SPHS4|nr:hypothetical protein M422DRAFT_259096 [Sphaerobolus stellatus SS14]